MTVTDAASQAEADRVAMRALKAAQRLDLVEQLRLQAALVACGFQLAHVPLDVIKKPNAGSSLSRSRLIE